MRLLSVITLIAVCFVCSPGSVGSKSAAEQPDISRSGSDFLEVCSSIDSEWKADPVRIRNDATCLGWVEGFGAGFTVHDELLSVPEKDRMVCIPEDVTREWIFLKSRLHHPAQSRETSSQIGNSRRDPDARSRRQPDHPSKHSNTVRSASASTLSVMRTCPFGSLISIAPKLHRDYVRVIERGQ